GADDTVHDPWLAAEFGHEPARLHRDHRGRPGRNKAPEHEAVARHAARAPNQKPEQSGEQAETNAKTDHRVERQVHNNRVRALVGWKRIEAAYLGVGIECGQDAQPIRDLDRVKEAPLKVARDASDVQWG